MEITMQTMANIATIVVPLMGGMWYVINLRIKVIEHDLQKLVEERKKDYEILLRLEEKLDRLCEKLPEKYVSKSDCERNMANCKSKKGE